MRKEGKPHGKPPLKLQCIKKMRRNKKQLLSNPVLHSKKTSQLCKFVLVEDFFEDVDVYMDLMKWMHH
jgi:predicted glycosyltransferase involved in capsule biosynthesis